MGEQTLELYEEKNRMLLGLDGSFGAEEADEAVEAAIEAAEQLDDGFEVITDISSFQPSDTDAMEHLERGKRRFSEMGLAAAVRVTPQSTTGQMQWERASGEDYQVAMTDSVEKAHELLDKRPD